MKDIHLSFRGLQPKKLVSLLLSGALALGVLAGMPFQVLADSPEADTAGIVQQSDVPEQPAPNNVVTCSDAQMALEELAKDEVTGVYLKDWAEVMTADKSEIFRAALPTQKSVEFSGVEGAATEWYFEHITRDVGDIDLHVTTEDTANTGALSGFSDEASKALIDFAHRGDLPGDATLAVWLRGDNGPLLTRGGEYTLYEFNSADHSYSEIKNDIQINENALAQQWISFSHGGTYVLSDQPPISQPPVPPYNVVTCSDAQMALEELAKDEVTGVSFRDWEGIMTEDKSEIFRAALPKQKSVIFYTVPRDGNESASAWNFNHITRDVGDVSLYVATEDRANTGALSGFSDEANKTIIDFAHRGDLPGEANVTIWPQDLLPAGTYTLYEFNRESRSYSEVNTDVDVSVYGQSCLTTITVSHGGTYVLSDQPPISQPPIPPYNVVTCSDAQMAVEQLAKEGVSGVKLAYWSDPTASNAEIFKAALAEQKEVIFQMNGENASTWRFEHVTKDVGDVDLSIFADYSENDAEAGFRGKRRIIDFTHRGELPGDATINLQMGFLPTRTYCLYEYDTDTHLYTTVEEAIPVVDHGNYSNTTIHVNRGGTYVLAEAAPVAILCDDAQMAIDYLAMDEVPGVILKNWPDPTAGNADIFKAALPKQKAVGFHVTGDCESTWWFDQITKDVGDVDLSINGTDDRSAAALAGFSENAVVYAVDFAHRGEFPGTAEVTFGLGDGMADGVGFSALYEYNPTTRTYTIADDFVELYGHEVFETATASISHGGTYVVSDQMPDKLLPEIKPGEVVTASDAEQAIEILKNENSAGVNVRGTGAAKDNAALFEAAKETGKTLKITVGAAEWFFDGKTMSEVKDVDLSVEVNAVNPEALTGFPEGTKSCVIQFAHHGTLPGPAEVNLYGIDLPAGSYSLYCFDPDTGKYELTADRVEVSEYHTATLKLTHCSTYVLSDTPVKAEYLKPDPTGEESNPPEEPGGEKKGDETTPTATTNTKTGETAAAGAVILLGVFSAGSLLLKRKKR